MIRDCLVRYLVVFRGQLGGSLRYGFQSTGYCPTSSKKFGVMSGYHRKWYYDVIMTSQRGNLNNRPYLTIQLWYGHRISCIEHSDDGEFDGDNGFYSFLVSGHALDDVIDLKVEFVYKKHFSECTLDGDPKFGACGISRTRNGFYSCLVYEHAIDDVIILKVKFV